MSAAPLGLAEIAVRGDQSWPPAGAEEVGTELLYERLAEAGYDYGPGFQGLRRVWRAGDEVFAEVALAEEHAVGAAGFCVHPALSDAALHALVLVALDGESSGELSVPFSFSGVRLYAGGASALRVCFSGHPEARSLIAFDEAGTPAFSIASVTMRPIDQSALRTQASSHQNWLYTVRWSPLPTLGSTPVAIAILGDASTNWGIEAPVYPDLSALNTALESSSAPRIVVVDIGAFQRHTSSAARVGDPLGAQVHAVTARALALLKRWLADERLSESRLILVTQEALTVNDAEAPNLVQSAVIGLIRSARSEHPGRFGVIDTDARESSMRALRAALACEEQEIVVRSGSLYTAVLTQVAPVAGAASPNTVGTVVITGGTGGLGGLLARHLARVHGVKRLVIASRSGPNAPDAEALQGDLAELGCDARVVACDVTRRHNVEELLAAASAESPLATVYHAAGILDDGVIEHLDQVRLERVLAPKVDAALHLHELAPHAELVFFSSMAGTLGTPGQANYAAANAFLDALARHRRHHGQPGVSLQWGAWATGMTKASDETYHARIARLGLVPLSDDQGLGLLDVARGVGAAVLAPVRLDLGALRAQARGGLLPAVLRGLVRAPARRASDQGSLARRLAGVPESEWDTFVLEFVRGHVAAVLGHASADAIDIDRAFNDLGFDSLGAIELRNRLTQAAGVRLSSTLVFDHPTTAAVAALLRSKVEGAGSAGSTVDAELDRLEAMFSALMRDDAAREQLDRRLRQLKARLGAFSAGVPDRDVVAGEDLDPASDADLAAIIEQELGS